MDILTLKHRDDIRYRGILTYRGLRLFALIMMTLSQYSAGLLLANSAANAFGDVFLSDFVVKLLTLLRPLGQITFPLLLISSFAIVLNGAESFKRMLITYFILGAITYLGIVLLLSNYLHLLVDSIPRLIPVLAKDLHLDQVPSALIERIVKMVLPGDGTLHLDSLNGILELTGARLRLPAQDQVLKLLTSVAGNEKTANTLLSVITNLDPNEVARIIEKYAMLIIKDLNIDFRNYWDTVLLPIVSTRVNAALNINVYWDLFLYTLCYFFIKYEPRNLHGGKLMLFRCCAFFPVTWMVLSVMISGNLRVLVTAQCPVWFTALMGRGNLPALTLFFLLVLFEKFRELEFRDRSDDSISWSEYRNGKKSSLQFSIYTSIVLCLVSVFDLLLSKLPTLSLWGLGKSYHMWIAAPVLMLFSYNKKPKHKFLNVVIPAYYVLHFTVLVLLYTGILVLAIQALTGAEF